MATKRVRGVVLGGGVSLALACLTCWYVGCATANVDTTNPPTGPEAGNDTITNPCSQGKLCDGGCINSQTDPNNCSTCGHVCAQGQGCIKGNCLRLTCDSPQINCADSGAAQCIDPSTDNANCGKCNNACGQQRACEAGVCNFNCTPPSSGCTDDAGAGSCVDLTSDNANCGKCGVNCPMVATCTSSICVCPNGLTLCPSDCIDTTNDNNNCGMCSKVCSGSTQCVSSVCVSPPSQSTVFVSSVVYQGGALGGLSGANAKCALLAKNAGLAGTFIAWLSDSKKDATTQMAHWSTPYVLADGVTQVAKDWTQLTSGTLQHAIDQTETKGAPPTGSLGANFVWTNTNANGTMYSSTVCSDWTNLSGSVSKFHFGMANQSNSVWTLNANSSYSGSFCGATAAIYCIGQ